MKHIYRTDDVWRELITREHGIPVSTFYRHVKILRQKACDVPAPVRENISPKQEVVPVQVTDTQNPDRIEGSFSMSGNRMQDPAIRIHMGSSYIDIMNHADTTLLSAAVMALKTLC